MGDFPNLPEDPIAERVLLGTLCSPGSEVAAQQCAFLLRPEDFMDPRHRAILEALQTLIERRAEIGPLTLKQVLHEKGTLGRVGGYPGLIELLNTEEVARPMVLVRDLQEKRRLRDLIKAGADMIRQAAAEEPSQGVIDGMCQRLAGMCQKQGDTGLVQLADITDAVLAQAIDEWDGKRQLGCLTGYPSLDKVTRGFYPGNLIILAARPGIGKTTLALNWALRMSRRGKRGALFSLEMARGEVTGKLLTDAAGMSLRKLNPNDSDIMARFHRAKAGLDKLPLCIDDRAQITAYEIAAKVDRETAKHGLDYVIIDYLQLISSPQGSNNKNEAVRVGEISRALKLLAKDRDIPVIVLSQLNREIEKRQTGRPQLSDLRDSGALEQDADMVMFIHRRTIPTASGEPDNIATLILDKHRNGPTGEFPLIWHGEVSRYEEPTPEQAQAILVKKPAEPETKDEKTKREMLSNSEEVAGDGGYEV